MLLCNNFWVMLPSLRVAVILDSCIGFLSLHLPVMISLVFAALCVCVCLWLSISLSFSLSLSLCVSLCLSISHSFSLSLSISLYFSLFFSVSLYFSLSLFLSLSISLSFSNLIIYLFSPYFVSMDVFRPCNQRTGLKVFWYTKSFMISPPILIKHC